MSIYDDLDVTELFNPEDQEKVFHGGRIEGDRWVYDGPLEFEGVCFKCDTKRIHLWHDNGEPNMDTATGGRVPDSRDSDSELGGSE